MFMGQKIPDPENVLLPMYIIIMLFIGYYILNKQ